MDKSSEDTSHLRGKIQELASKWDTVCELSIHKQDRLEDALKEVRFTNTSHKFLCSIFIIRICFCTCANICFSSEEIHDSKY